MGTVTVNTDNGPINFTIQGDTPTPIELNKIQRIIMRQAPAARERSVRKKDEQLFDYKTGIKDLNLRRALSRADNKQEEELVLKSKGLLETDFTRDRKGKLALTPSGAEKFGVKSNKNVLIDERGFSRSDFADLSSLGREIAGGVAGALAGQAAIPIPILGAAIGAGLGTGGAKLIEEGQEVIEGTQGQEAKEVFKDAAVEAAIGAAGEGIFGTIGSLFGRVVKGRPGGDLTPQQLTAAGESLEEGITPTLSQIGASPLIARQQAMSEKVMKTSKRLRENHERILEKITKFRGDYGAANAEDAADVLISAAKRGNKSIEKTEKEITKSLVKNLREANEALGAATLKDEAIDEDLYKIVRDSYKLFDEQMQKEFGVINKLVDDATGSIAAFDMKAIKADAKTRLNQFTGVSTGNQAIAKNMLQDIANLPNKASFAQIYRARKNLNDTWLSRYGSSNVSDVKKKFLDRLDDKLDIKEINKALGRVSLRDLSGEQKELYKAASRQIVPARAAFKEGIKEFEALNGKLGIRKLVADVKGEKTPDFNGAMTSIIKDNNPRPLKEAAKAVSQRNKNFEPIRERLAGEWMRQAFRDSVKENASGNFSAKIFKERLEKLGTTGKELFGEQKLAEIKKLAEQMSVINLSRLSDGMVDDLISSGGDTSAVNLLRSLKTVSDEKAALDKSKAFKQLQDGSITVESAAEVIASGATKDTDVVKLMKFFDDPEDLTKIRSFYVDNIVGDFGDSFLTDPKQFKLFGDRLQKEFKTGKLTTIFGKEMADDMNKFGRILVFNSKAAEGGDLVAANIAASPLENIGKIARLGIFGRVLSSAPQYKSITNQYDKLTKGASPKTKAQVLGNLLAQAFGSAAAQTPIQVIQEGAEEGAKQVSSIIESTQRQPKTTPPPTPVPKVLPPIETSSVNQKRNIRQRAKENPAIASTLLGGLGSAGLL